MTEETYVDEYAAAAATERLEQPSILADVAPLLGVGVRFLICLFAIGMGVRITTSGGSQLIAVLAALACAGVIYGLLSPRREV